MRVHPITEALRQQYRRDFGEDWLCALSNPAEPRPDDCGGLAELYVSIPERKCTLPMCRGCVADFVAQLQDSVAMLDQVERMTWGAG